MRKLVAYCLTLGTLVLAPSRTMAQESDTAAYPACDHTPSEGDVAAAQGLFQAGKTSFNEADYAQAISYWEDAYRRDCTAHLLLMNLARAYELNDQKRQAITALETYQERNPGSAQDEALSKRIQKLKEQLPAEQSAQPPPEPVETEAEPAPPPVPVTSGPAPLTTEEPQPSGRSIAPLIVAGAGGALMIGSGIVWIVALKDLSDFEEQCPDRDCVGMNSGELQEDGNAARKRANISGALAGVGVAATAGGLIWYFLQDDGKQQARERSRGIARVVPEVGANYAGVGFSGAF